jgi:hypothetical protein
LYLARGQELHCAIPAGSRVWVERGQITVEVCPPGDPLGFKLRQRLGAEDMYTLPAGGWVKLEAAWASELLILPPQPSPALGRWLARLGAVLERRVRGSLRRCAPR